jgi:hypothetical protein
MSARFRPLCVSLLMAALAGAPAAAADDPPPHVAAGYSFVAKQHRTYAYELRQDVVFASAGDTLTYTTRMLWTFVMMPITVAADRAELAVSILTVKASLEGPASRHVYDSSERDPERRRDPLFAHLAALDGARLMVTVDPRTGAVAQVDGGDAIAAAVAKAEPSKVDPSEPSPLAAAAREAYGSGSLARMWGEMLALPASAPQRVALAAPFAGELERVWTGSAFTWQLPAGVDHADVRLGRDPVRVSGSLTEVAGAGRIDLAEGMPGTAEGDLTFTLTLDALTQPVVQHHRLHWKLSTLTTLSGR